MVFTLIVVSLGGLFLVGYGVWAIAEDRRGFRPRNPRNRALRRDNDTSSLNPMDPSSPLFWTTWGFDNTSASGSSQATSASEAYSGGGSDSSSGGSCDCSGSDSSSSSSCDSGSGSSSSD